MQPEDTPSGDNQLNSELSQEELATKMDTPVQHETVINTGHLTRPPEQDTPEPEKFDNSMANHYNNKDSDDEMVLRRRNNSPGRTVVSLIFQQSTESATMRERELQRKSDLWYVLKLFTSPHYRGPFCLSGLPIAKVMVTSIFLSPYVSSCATNAPDFPCGYMSPHSPNTKIMRFYPWPLQNVLFSLFEDW